MGNDKQLYLSLNDNVFTVNGFSHDCIYDFNSMKLYQINHKLYKLLNNINLKTLNKSDISNSEIDIINQLLKSNLVKYTKYKKINAIDNLIPKEYSIKFAWIEVTNKCNLKCVHCYNESDSKCNKTMNIEDFKETIDSIVKLSVKRIQIIGGEPFVIKNILKEMLDYAMDKFEYIEIFTNGTLLDNEWIDYLKEKNIRIALSVYSYNEEEHDKVTRCNGSWKKTNSIIEKLNKHAIKYRVCNTIMKNVDLGECNTSLYKLNPRKDIIRMSGRGNLSLLSRSQIKEKLITKERFSSPLNMALCLRIMNGHNCFSNKIYVSADKTIYPCVMERRINHGKINDKKEILLNEKILSFNKDCIDECKKCEFRYACFDCRPDSLVKNIFEKPWYCTYNPEKGIWANTEDFIDKIIK